MKRIGLFKEKNQICDCSRCNQMPSLRRRVTWLTRDTIFILEGKWVIGAHVQSETDNLICLRRKSDFFLKMPVFLHPCARRFVLPLIISTMPHIVYLFISNIWYIQQYNKEVLVNSEYSKTDIPFSQRGVRILNNQSIRNFLNEHGLKIVSRIHMS